MKGPNRMEFRTLDRWNPVTDRWIHTQHGFGYCVCEDCYNIELSTEMKLKGLL